MKTARKRWSDSTKEPLLATINRQVQDKAAAVAEHEASSETARIKTDESALKFILGGNATFTLRSKKTGTRYTYKVMLAPPRESAPPQERSTTFFVNLLSGPDNEHDFVYLGIIRTNVFSTTAKSRMNMESKPVKAFHWAFANLVKYMLPAELEIWHEGRCGRCNRKLTVPESIASGFGPECAGRMEGGL